VSRSSRSKQRALVYPPPRFDYQELLWLSQKAHKLIDCDSATQRIWAGPVYDLMVANQGWLESLSWWRRGFIESITCSWQDWLTHNKAIRAAAPLRSVTFTTWPEIERAGDNRSNERIRITGGQWVRIWLDTNPWKFPSLRFILSTLCRAEWPGINFTLPE
jgi:hypothetical protein